MTHRLPTVADMREDDVDASAVVCTALVVWHGALASTATPSGCPRDFLRFSHVVGHIISKLCADVASFNKLSACWLYNTLKYSYCSKNIKAVAFYLFEELYDEAPVAELEEAGEWQLVCAVGKNACPRAGLRGQQVLALWNRLCVALYNEGCMLLQAAQRSVCGHACGMIEILRQVFDGETTRYLPQFKQLPRMSPNNLAQLYSFATKSDLVIGREMFTHSRVACWLKSRVAEEEDSAYSIEFSLASLSSIVALALRHRHGDIAVEILRACSTAKSGGNDDSYLLWGTELESLIEKALMTAPGCDKLAGNSQKGFATAHQHICEARPRPLLHEIMRGQCTANMLQTLLLSEKLEELLPVGLAVIREDGAVVRRLLEDKIAPSLLLEGLSRLILGLVYEGDLPLARCFLPLVAGICERMPSQANLLLTLRAIAAFMQSCPQDVDTGMVVDGQQENISAAVLLSMPPGSFGTAPPYKQTKAAVVGRTFSFRRRVFESLCECVAQSSNPGLHCQLQLLFTSDYEAVRLLRSSSSSAEEPLRWEKVLPVGKKLLTVAATMREIECENQRHLCMAETSAGSVDATTINGGGGGGGGPRTEGPREKREEWWEKRRALDRAMQNVVAELQSDEVFGCWRAAMCGELPSNCRAKLWTFAAELLREIGASAASHVADVALMLAALPFLATGHPAHNKLLFNPSHNDTDETACALCDGVLRAASEALERELFKQGIAEPSCAIFSAFRVACRCALSAMWDVAEAQENESGHRDLLRLPRASLYLVLDNELHCLPFEGIDVLWTNSVARVPTSSFVFANNMRSRLFDENRVFCAFDPTVAMPKTMKRLLPVFQQNGWKTSTESTQSGEELLREMYSAKAQLYVYVGHGKGERLLHREELYERFPDPERFPATFLMGCGSAYMDSGFSYDCYGMPYAFLHAGCPLFLGCLWHVTDGEIDRLTKRLLLLLAGGHVDGEKKSCLRPPGTVGEALVLARQACRLPFLTGCAAVFYGVDLSLRSE